MDIPNLFNATDEAERLYSLMLARLSMHDAFEEVLEAASKIRQHAIETVGERAALFTYSPERDAFWYLGRHDENWERHVRHETILFGGLLNLTSSTVEERDIYLAAEFRAPLHYACGRLCESAECKELRLALAIPRTKSDNIFYEVTNDDDEPTHPVRVTLRHIYEALGKSLKEWNYWSSFVARIPDTLFAAAKTTKEEVHSNPTLLAAIDTALSQRYRHAAPKTSLEITNSPWESELLKWFPFIESYPRGRPSADWETA